MYDNQSKGISYTAGFFIVIVLVILGVTLAEAINKPIWLQLTGQEYTDASRYNPAYTNALKIIHAVNAILSFFIPALVAAALLHHKPVQLLGFSSTIKLNQVVIVILIILASMVVSTALSYFNNQVPLPHKWRLEFDKLENEYNQQIRAIIILKNWKDYVLSLVIMAFLPALCEETLFRGGLQNFLARGTQKPWLSIIIVSILFSVAHFSFYGFLYRVFLGIILGAIFHYSGKLWLSILAHFINNAIALTFLYLGIEQWKTAGFWGILALPVVIGLFILFQRVSAGNRRPA